jgi:ribosomal-protein-alanine N-acetyltransferase
MIDSDIPQVLEIDQDAFPTQWPHPTMNSFKHELRNKLAHYIVVYQDCDSKLPDRQEQDNIWLRTSKYIKHLFNHNRFFGGEEVNSRQLLAGMAGIWMMVDEAHIVTIGVRKFHRNRGLGEWLLISIIDMAMELGAKIITLEVRISNITAQKLYEKYGFSIVGIRRKYYSDNGEDAFIMSIDDLSSESFHKRLEQLKLQHASRWSCYCDINYKIRSG